MAPKILLVDDHDGLRQLLRDWLTAEFPQCRIVEARCGEDAIEFARREFPDILVMDIGLPGISGIEATRQIKQFLPAVRTVMLTIHEDKVSQADANLAGADAYIVKSRVQKEFLPTMSALLEYVFESEQPAFGATHVHVLIVEDEPITRMTHEQHIRSLGWDCTSCEDAATALEACRHTFYPLIIQDLGLPDSSGLELCRRIRALPDGQRSVILMISAQDDSREIQAAYEAGANDFLHKPFTPEHLNERITILLRQFRQEEQQEPGKPRKTP